MGGGRLERATSSNDPDNPTRGRSVGQWQQDGVNVPEACRTLTGQ